MQVSRAKGADLRNPILLRQFFQIFEVSPQSYIDQKAGRGLV